MGYLEQYNKCCLRCEGSEDIASKRSKNRHFRQPHSHLTPPLQRISANIRIKLTLLETRIHAFVTSHVDYCNAVLAGAPRYFTDKLQRVLNAAARLVTGTRKFDRGFERLLHDDLHWLDVPERVQFKLGLTVRRCLRRRAPMYLVDYCMSVSDVVSRQHLRSASRHSLSAWMTLSTRVRGLCMPSVSCVHTA